MKRALQQLSVVFTIFLIGVGLLGCSSPQQKVSERDSVTEATSATPTPTQTPKSIGAENFEKDWKSRYEAAATELERNRALWKEAKIVNYDFVAMKMAGGNTNTWNRSPVIIRVRDGVKTSIELEEKPHGSYMERTDGFEDIDTIDKLFDYLLRERASGKILENKYDKKSGYPKTAVIVDSWQTHGSRSIQLSKFDVIK